MPAFKPLHRHRLAMPLLLCALASWTSSAASEGLARASLRGDPPSASLAPLPSAEGWREFKPASGRIQRTLSSRYGTGVVSSQVRNEGGELRVARLDTTWTAMPFTRGDTLRLGDGVDRAGTWGRPVRFGGVQYGTNLGDVLRTASPASSSALLGRGLVDRAVAFGRVRSDYGLDADRYGPAFASAILRRGLLDDVTVEVRGSVQRGMENGGAALQVRIGGLGVLSAATAGSRSEAGIGRLAQTGFEHRGAGFRLSIGSQWTDASFRHWSEGTEGIAPRRWSTARASCDLDAYGALGIGYSALVEYGAALSRIVQGTYRVALGRVNALTLNFSYTLAPAASTSVMLTFSIPLDAPAGTARAKPPGWSGMRGSPLG